jgi:hypothetical protein
MSANDVIALDSTIADSHAARAPEQGKAEYFEVFVAEQLLKDFHLSDEEIQAGLVGGPEDAGLDGFYFIVDGVLVGEETDLDPKHISRADLVLVQATTEAGFNENRINKLHLVTDDLLNLGEAALKGTYSPELRTLILRFKEKYKSILHLHHSMTVSFHYVSKGDRKTVNAALQKRAEAVRTNVVEYLSAAQCNFEFTGAAELLALTRRQPKRLFTLPLSGSPVSPKGQTAFIGLVPIAAYHAFLVDEAGELRSDLFAANVRDYQGNVKVNRAIQETLNIGDEEEDFWWLNNGVTILASNATHSGTILTIHDPQIVNGLQTSRSIYNFFKSHPDRKNDPRQVLVRIISVPKAESQDRIIKATNSQTAMPDYQLYATEQTQMDIEAALKAFGLFYDRRKNFYKNLGKPISKIVSPLYLAQSIISVVLQRPNDARASPSRVLASERSKIFSKSNPLEAYTACLRLMRQVDDYLRAKGTAIDRTTKSNIRFYMALDVACTVTGKPNPKIKQIAKIALPINETLLEESYNRVGELYAKFGGTDQAAKGNEMVAGLKSALIERLS